MRRRDFLRAAAATALAACAPTTTPSPSGDIVGSMSLERKVGQLISVAFHGTKITSSLEAMIRDRGIGGVILYSENFTDAAGLAKLVADLDQIARDARSLPDRKSTRLNSSHLVISYAVFCLKKKNRSL